MWMTSLNHSESGAQRGRLLFIGRNANQTVMNGHVPHHNLIPLLVPLRRPARAATKRRKRRRSTPSCISTVGCIQFVSKSFFPPIFLTQTSPTLRYALYTPQNTVESGSNLAPKDSNNLSDPFVELYLDSEKIAQTAVIVRSPHLPTNNLVDLSHMCPRLANNSQPRVAAGL